MQTWLGTTSTCSPSRRQAAPGRGRPRRGARESETTRASGRCGSRPKPRGVRRPVGAEHLAAGVEHHRPPAWLTTVARAGQRDVAPASQVPELPLLGVAEDVDARVAARSRWCRRRRVGLRRGARLGVEPPLTTRTGSPAAATRPRRHGAAPCLVGSGLGAGAGCVAVAGEGEDARAPAARPAPPRRPRRPWSGGDAGAVVPAVDLDQQLDRRCRRAARPALAAPSTESTPDGDAGHAGQVREAAAARWSSSHSG